MPVKSAGTIVRSRHEPSKPARLSSKQAARLDAMTDDQITAAAVSDPDAQPWTDDDLARAKQAFGARIKITRLKLGMSQADFAEAFGFSLRALQDWERGRAEPPAAIRSYLRVIEREPEAVMRALA
jgi:putative transcriptional regulator